MTGDFNEHDCDSWDNGILDQHTMINILISKIRDLIAEVNELKKENKVIVE